MPSLQYKKDTYKYFKTFNPDIDNGLLLDYGCNYGTFLESSNGAFNQTQYTGIDVDAQAVNHGRQMFPDAQFIHYNGYNAMYNPSGENKSQLTFNSKFQNVISYSVLTHTSITDMMETIEWLYGLTKPGGTLMLTFLNVDDPTTNNFFTQKRISRYGSCDPITTDTYTYLINNKLSKNIQPASHVLLFFKIEYLKECLSKYDVEIYDAPPNINGCFQSCIIIYKQ